MPQWEVAVLSFALGCLFVIVLFAVGIYLASRLVEDDDASLFMPDDYVERD